MGKEADKKPIIDQKLLKDNLRKNSILVTEKRINDIIDENALEAFIKTAVYDRIDSYCSRVISSSKIRIATVIINSLSEDNLNKKIETELNDYLTRLLKKNYIIDSDNEIDNRNIRSKIYQIINDTTREAVENLLSEEEQVKLLDHGREVLAAGVSQYLEQDIPEVVKQQLGLLYQRVQEMDTDIRELKDSNYKIESIRTNLENHERRNSH